MDIPIKVVAHRDEGFYLANEARVRGKDKIDLRTGPPPTWRTEWVKDVYRWVRNTLAPRRAGQPL